MTRKINIILVVFALVILYACTKEDIYDNNYDIQYKVANIHSFSPETAYIGDTIEIMGENLDDKTLQVFLGANQMQIVKGSATSEKVKVIVPRSAIQSKIRVLTYFTADSRNNPFSKKDFIPKYPKVEFSLIPDTLFVTQAFKVKGVNLDLITNVAIGDTIIPITNTNPAEASFDFTKVKFTKAIVPLNFVTRNKDNFTDREVVVMEDLPKIKILAQIPDPVGVGEKVTLVYDKPEFGKFINKVSIEHIKDTTFTYVIDPVTKDTLSKEIKKINLHPDMVLNYELNANKISFSIPDIPTTGKIKITGLYRLSTKYDLMMK